MGSSSTPKSSSFALHTEMHTRTAGDKQGPSGELSLAALCGDNGKTVSPDVRLAAFHSAETGGVPGWDNDPAVHYTGVHG
jgi:hypothetical protein